MRNQSNVCRGAKAPYCPSLQSIILIFIIINNIVLIMFYNYVVEASNCVVPCAAADATAENFNAVPYLSFTSFQRRLTADSIPLLSIVV